MAAIRRLRQELDSKGDSPIFVGRKLGQSPGEALGRRILDRVVRLGCESVGRDHRPGQLPPGHGRPVSRRRGDQTAGLSSGRDSGRRPRRGRGTFRLRRRQSALDRLGQPARRVSPATRPLWERYGLFSLSAARPGTAGRKKTSSMLCSTAPPTAIFAAGGRLGMVVTQTLFQTQRGRRRLPPLPPRAGRRFARRRCASTTWRRSSRFPGRPIGLAPSP